MTNTTVYRFKPDLDTEPIKLTTGNDQGGVDNKEDSIITPITPGQSCAEGELDDGQLVESTSRDVTSDSMREPSLVCKIDLSKLPLLSKFKPGTNVTKQETEDKQLYYSSNKNDVKSLEPPNKCSETSPLVPRTRRSLILERYEQRISCPDYYHVTSANPHSEQNIALTNQTRQIDLYDLNKTLPSLVEIEDSRASFEVRTKEGGDLTKREYFYSDISGRRADILRPYTHKSPPPSIEDLYCQDSFKSGNCEDLEIALSSLKINQTKESVYFHGDVNNIESSMEGNTKLSYEGKQTLKNEDVVPCQTSRTKPKTCDYFQDEVSQQANYFHSHSDICQSEAKCEVTSADSRVSVHVLQPEDPCEYTAYLRHKHSRFTDIPDEGLSLGTEVDPKPYKTNASLEGETYFSSARTGGHTRGEFLQGNPCQSDTVLSTSVDENVTQGLNFPDTHTDTEDKINPYASSLRVSALDEEIQVYYKPQWRPLRDTSSDGGYLRHQELCDTSETNEEGCRVIGSVVLEHLHPPVVGRVYLKENTPPENLSTGSSDSYTGCLDASNCS